MTFEQFSDAFDIFMQASLEEKPGVLREYEALLLADDIEAWLREVLEQVGGTDTHQAIADHIEGALTPDDSSDKWQVVLSHVKLIRRCRDVGIDVAFEELAERRRVGMDADGRSQSQEEENSGQNSSLRTAVIELCERAEAIRGENPAALDAKIALLKEALHLLEDTSSHGQARGAIHRALGDLLQIQSKATADIGTFRLAEEAYRDALNEYSQENAPMEWAGIQNNLGTLLQIMGEATGNLGALRGAEEAYREALKERRQNNAPMDWAMTQNNLGALLTMLGGATGDTSTLRRAGEAYQNALKERRRENAPMDWAETQNNLGAFLEVLGETTGDIGTLRRAEEAYQKALKERRRENAPMDWAATQNNLGHLLRTLGEATGNIETLRRAEDAYQEALKEYRQDNAPMPWAMTQNNLGNLLQALGAATGAIGTLRQAEDALQEALKERRQDTAPMAWAMNQADLGLLLQTLGETTGDLDTLGRAEEAYREALKEYRQDNTPMDWAATQNNLGNLLQIMGEATGNLGALRGAEEAYREALKERRQNNAPMDWAMTQNNLGNLLQALGEATGDIGTLHQAEDAFQQALKERRQDNAPIDWAATQNNLGALLQTLGKATGDIVTLRRAEEAYREALKERGRNDTPKAWSETMANLSNLYRSMEDWVSAIETLQDLLSGTALTVATTPMPGEARGVLRSARGQGDLLSWLLLQDGRASEALGGAEFGRAISLRAHSAQVLFTTEGEVSEHLLNWRAAVARAEAAGQSINEEVQEAFGAFRQALDDAGLGVPESLSVAEIGFALPDGSVFVLPIVTEYGGAIFFVRQGQTELTDDHVLMMPELTTEAVQHLLARKLDGQDDDAPPVEDDDAAAAEGWTGWLPGYMAFRASINQYFQPRRGAVAAWNSQIESTLSEMWDLIMKPVHNRLIQLGLTPADKTENAEALAPEVILALPGTIATLPWHAAGYEMEDGSRSYALSSWAFSYTPSIGTLITGRRKLEKLRDTPNSLLAVTNPSNDFLASDGNPVRQTPVWDLFEDPYRTDLKGAKVAASHHDDVATLARITEAMPEAKYYVMYTHGSGNLLGVDTAALTTADFPLTPEHLRRMNLEAARYAMLAACDSGTLDIQHLPDEFSGMQLSMLEAGCPGACGTLWPVEVSVTAPLVREFFSHHLGQPGTGGLSPAQALRKVQLNMLDHAEPAPDSAVASTASGFDEDEDTGETQPKDGNTQEYQRRPDVALPFFWAAFAHWGV